MPEPPRPRSRPSVTEINASRAPHTPIPEAPTSPPPAMPMPPPRGMQGPKRPPPPMPEPEQPEQRPKFDSLEISAESLLDELAKKNREAEELRLKLAASEAGTTAQG